MNFPHRPSLAFALCLTVLAGCGEQKKVTPKPQTNQAAEQSQIRRFLVDVNRAQAAHDWLAYCQSFTAKGRTSTGMPPALDICDSQLSKQFQDNSKPGPDQIYKEIDRYSTWEMSVIPKLPVEINGRRATVHIPKQNYHYKFLSNQGETLHLLKVDQTSPDGVYSSDWFIDDVSYPLAPNEIEVKGQNNANN